MKWIRWLWLAGLRQSSYCKLGATESDSPCSFQKVGEGREPLLVLLVLSQYSFPAHTSGGTEISKKAGVQPLGGVWSNRIQSEGIGKAGIEGIRRQRKWAKRDVERCQRNSCLWACLRQWPLRATDKPWSWMPSFQQLLTQAVVWVGLSPELKHRYLFLYPLLFCWRDFKRIPDPSVG